MATLNLQVGAATDDAAVWVANTSTAPHTFTGFGTGGTGQTAGENGTSRHGFGMRLAAVTIANADTIDVSYLTFTAKVTISGTIVRTDIYGEDADDAATYSTLDDYNGRAKLATVAWDSIAAWTLDTEYNSPSLVTPTQAIVNRAGWASGNDMGWKWEDGDADDQAYRQAYTYDADTTKAPKLHIEYTAGGVTFVPRLMVV